MINNYHDWPVITHFGYEHGYPIYIMCRHDFHQINEQKHTSNWCVKEARLKTLTEKVLPLPTCMRAFQGESHMNEYTLLVRRSRYSRVHCIYMYLCALHKVHMTKLRRQQNSRQLNYIQRSAVNRQASDVSEKARLCLKNYVNALRITTSITRQKMCVKFVLI